MSEPAYFFTQLDFENYLLNQDMFDALQSSALRPNLFADPRAIAASVAAGVHKQDVCVLVAACYGTADDEWIGAWPLRRVTHFGLTGLSTHFHLYAPCGAPVLHRDHAGAALDHLLMGACQLGAFLHGFDVDEAMAHHAAAACARLRLAFRRFGLNARGVLERGEDAGTLMKQVFSASRRHTMRKQKKRLEKTLGPAAYSKSSSNAALEDFLQLERSGWKGRRGTSITSHISNARFVSTLYNSLALTGEAYLSCWRAGPHLLAAGLILQTQGYYWFLKIAYDESQAAFSPGVHYATALVEDVLKHPAFREADSCARLRGGPHVALCRTKRVSSQIFIHLQQGSFPFTRALALVLIIRHRLKALAKAILSFRL